MKKIILFLMILASFALANSVQDILSQMPAETGAQRDELSAELISLGEPAILQICTNLGAMGDDNTAAQLAIAGLCDYVGGPAGKKSRPFVQSALLKALAENEKSLIKIFLMNQLALIGDSKVINELEPYLLNNDLVDPAVRTMTTIDPQQAASVLIKNLPKANEQQLLSMINALGEIGCDNVVSEILPYAKSDDEKLRDVALFALSKNKSPQAGDALRAAIKNSQGLERDKAYSYYCIFIDGQDKTSAVELYRQLLKDDSPAYVLCWALNGLFAIERENCLPDLLAAAQKDDELCACALRLTDSLPEEDVSKKWIDFARNASPPKQALVVRAFANRSDTSAQDFVKNSLKSESPQVRLAAISVYAHQQGSAAYDELLTVMKNGLEDEVMAAAEALLSFSSDEQLLDRLDADFFSLPDVSQVAVLNMFTSRFAVNKKETLFAKARDKNSEIRIAALQGLAALADSTDVDRLLQLLQHSKDEAELDILQNALVQAGNTAKYVNAAPFLKAYEKSDQQQQVVLINVLSQLASKNALMKVIGLATSEKDDMRSVAVKALASGPQPDAIPELLSIAKESKQDNIKNLALQKAMRLTRDNWRLSIEDRLAYCKMLMDAVETNDEKLRVIDIAAREQDHASLDFIEPYLESADLQRGAAKTAVHIATPDGDDRAGLTDEKAITILLKVLAIPADEETIERAKSHLRTLGVIGLNPETGEDLNQPPPGFVALFNGRDLSGWKGLAGKGGSPPERAKLSAEEMKIEQAKADSIMRAHWSVENGVLVFDGHGSHLCTQKEYRNFEMLVDWKIQPGGDSGIYLRGSPQVQIWDPAQWPEGSGGLYNNQIGPSKPLVKADFPIGEWNTFRIKMIDDHVTVHLNDVLVVENVVLENYWDRDQPIFPTGQIELQSHGSMLYFRNVFLREIFTEEDGWTPLFDGESLNGWQGAVDGYTVQNGSIVSKPGSGGNLYTDKEYSDFDFTFEFKLAPGANSGLGIRAPLKGDAAYVGMELQILDNSALQYADLHEYQYHGSVYGVVPAKRGFQKMVGEWNTQQVSVKGNRVKIELNGVTILDADVKEASTPNTADNRKHPGLKNKKGYIGFLGHHAHVEFRNIYIREK